MEETDKKLQQKYKESVAQALGMSVEEAQQYLHEKDMAAICKMLEEQLDDLKLEQRYYAHSHPERQLAYELLYHSNKKKRQEAIKLWQSEMDQETKQNKELVKTLKNLTTLKEVLQERRSQHHDFIDWLFDDN